MSTGPTPAITSPAPVTTPAEAEALTAQFIQVMESLVGIVQQETELVRSGHLGRATALEQTKAELTRRYIAHTLRLRASKSLLSRIVPAAKLAALRQRHDAFRALLQINLTVLATA